MYMFGIHNISTADVTKILRYPGQALDHDTAHSLDVLGGFRMVGLRAYMESYMARTALTTLRDFPDQSKDLLDLSLDSFPFVSPLPLTQ